MNNIDETGAPSMMMHMVAHALAYDPHSGDFGLGFFGNALESGAYYVEDPTLGPLCFLCEVGGGDYSLCPKLRLKLSKPGLKKPGANFTVVAADLRRADDVTSFPDVVVQIIIRLDTVAL